MLYDVQITAQAGQMKNGLAEAVDFFRIHAVDDQQASQIRVAFVHGPVETIVAVVVLRVDFGAATHQVSNKGRVAILTCGDQRRIAFIVLNINVYAFIHFKLQTFEF